jgi:hypothetical protein
MRWAFPIAVAAIAATLWLPGEAAQPATDAAANKDAISFGQYRDWRNVLIERRRIELSVELSAKDLSPPRKTRLEQVKAYYEWFAGLPEEDRNRRFRERFDRIDSNHDGTIDSGERVAWREKQSAFYHRADASSRQPAELPPMTSP